MAEQLEALTRATQAGGSSLPLQYALIVAVLVAVLVADAVSDKVTDALTVEVAVEECVVVAVEVCVVSVHLPHIAGHVTVTLKPRLFVPHRELWNNLSHSGGSDAP